MREKISISRYYTVTYTLCSLIYIILYQPIIPFQLILLNLRIFGAPCLYDLLPSVPWRNWTSGALWSSTIQLPRTHLFIKVIGSPFQQVYLVNLFLTHVCLSLIRGWFWSDTHHFLHTKLRGKSDTSCIQLY